MLTRESSTRPSGDAGARRPSAFGTGLALTLPFLIGIATTLILWERMSLPFNNPWNIISPLTVARYNPSNNVLRFAVLVLSPIAILLLTALLGRDRMAWQAIDGEPPTLPVRHRRRHALIWSTAVLAIALSVAMNRSARLLELDLFHEGESLGAAVSWEAGRAPYSGIVIAHGAYEEPLRSVLAFRVFGRSIGATRTLESIQKIATYAALALLVIQLFGAGPSGCAAMGVLAAALATRWVSVQGRDLMTVVFMTCFLELLNAPKRGRSSLTVIAGFLWPFTLIVSFAVSVDRGWLLLVAFVLLAPVIFVALRRMEQFSALIIAFVAGAAAGCVLLGLALRGEFGAFIDFAILKMPRYWDLMDGYVFPIFEPPYLIAAVLVALNTYWLAVHIIAHVAVNRRVEIARVFERYGVELGVGVLSLVIFRAALGRADIPHLTTSVWPSIVVSLLIARREFSRVPGPQVLGRAAVAALCALGIGVGLAGLGRVYTNDLISRNFPLHVPDSQLIPVNYAETVRFLKDNLEEDEGFLAYNNEAIWYYFIDRPAPGRFYIPWFAAPEEDQVELVRDLESSGVRYVLYRNNGPASNLDGMSNVQRLPVVTDYLARRFRFLTRIDDNEIWESIDAQ